MEKERRKFKRFDAYMSVKFGNSDEKQKKAAVIALTKDVSRDGICVNSVDSLEQGSLLNLEIDLPDDPRPIHTSGKVVWSRGKAEADGVDSGIQFVAIDPVDKFRVLDYAYNHWLETKINDFNDPELPTLE
ncbi:MAG: PilZ domain-containing protein [Candidatus Omnitrophica bacterium]|nr:PilZ domain-containing protein [Candidatus Omnitrophota bacterium]